MVTRTEIIDIMASLSPSFQTQSMPSMPSMPHRWWHQYQLPRGHRNYSRIEEPQRQGHVSQIKSMPIFYEFAFSRNNQ